MTAEEAGLQIYMLLRRCILAIPSCGDSILLGYAVACFALQCASWQACGRQVPWTLCNESLLQVANLLRDADYILHVLFWATQPI